MGREKGLQLLPQFWRQKSRAAEAPHMAFCEMHDTAIQGRNTLAQTPLSA